ncbi:MULTISPECIES: hypothetical protein [Actinosynnema]|uniref:hypothetical protein n=1 Tax=Actinosynnema TaxID=40566 RepID=UPI0020A3E978|nr:hypothetical protein [Actinosynnema pretiosum]MCP2093134.1 hypothetical protein [Actinosynnema pretiosum]
MDYRWRYQDERGGEVDGPTAAFPGQSEAEEWLAARGRELRAAGVAAVTLLRSESEVYGPLVLA